MKRFVRIVGMLLCLAMVLSVLPASIVSAAATDTKAVSLTPVTGLATPEFGYYTNGTTGAERAIYRQVRHFQQLIGNVQTDCHQTTDQTLCDGTRQRIDKTCHNTCPPMDKTLLWTGRKPPRPF